MKLLTMFFLRSGDHRGARNQRRERGSRTGRKNRKIGIPREKGRPGGKGRFIRRIVKIIAPLRDWYNSWIIVSFLKGERGFNGTTGPQVRRFEI